MNTKMVTKGNITKVTINGETITCTGSNVAVINRKVIVDGKVIKENICNNTEIIIKGDVNKLECSGNVKIYGDCNCKIDCGGNVTAGLVNGSIDAGGNVTCNNVYGDIDAGGNVSCRRIK